MKMNLERQMLPSDALNIALETIKFWELEASITSVGNEIKTYHCKLIDPKKRLIFYGCGKGLGLQSKVSACYEALEHYAIYRYCQEMASKEENYASSPPSASMVEIRTGERLHYPLYLIDPRYPKQKNAMDTFDYHNHSWNACDSGTASGTSMIEASIHALNESIERDAYSLFLINAYMLNRPPKVILKNTLPLHLQKIVHQIESDYREDIVLIDMTSNIGVPSILASLTKQPCAIQPIGCGSSLFRDYAIERALLESLQPLHLRNDHLERNSMQVLENFKSFPLLYKCAKGDIQVIAQHAVKIDFNSIMDYDTTSTLDKQHHDIVTMIQNKGYEIFSLPIADIQTGFKCIKYFIPDLEQFYLVELGKFVLPSTRGKQLIATHSGKLI